MKMIHDIIPQQILTPPALRRGDITSLVNVIRVIIQGFLFLTLISSYITGVKRVSFDA